MINYQVFQDEDHFKREAPNMLKRIGAFWNWDNKLVLQYDTWREPRSRSQLNLYREWLKAMADFFSTRDNLFTDEDMHDLCRHKFLGYETKRVGKTEIRDQLRSTANGKISKADMSEYMHKVDVWATEMGCYLPHPEDNEYSKYREART